MRFAPRCTWRLFVWLIAICPFAFSASTTHGWGFGTRQTAEPLPSQGGLQISSSIGTVPRWTDGGAMQQQGAGTAPVYDPAVQQAGYTAALPSAARPSTRYPSGAANPSGAAVSPGRKGPMFRGYQLRMPTLFGRSDAKDKVPAPAASRPTTPNRVAASRTRQLSPVAAAQAQPIDGAVQRRPVDGGLSAASHLQPVPNAAVTHAVAVANNMPRQPARKQISQQAPPTPTLAPARPNNDTDDRAAVDTSAAGMAAKASEAAAEKLAALAHQWSATAETDADFTRIITTCRRVGASRPSAAVATYASELSAWALNRRGQLKAEAGLIKEALLDFDDAIRADTSCWRAIHNRGVLLAQEGQFEKAFDDFNRTIELNSEFAKAYSNRGALFVVADDLPAALDDYGRAIELDPNLAIAHRGRGRVCHLLGQLDEAIGHYDAAIQLTPNDGYAVASRGDLLTDLGRYAEAAADYDRAIELDPQSEHAYSGSAWLLATCPDNRVANPQLAIERARVAIELAGKDEAVSFDTLAAAQASAGEFQLAAETVQQAIQLAAPDERAVYRDRLRLYQQAQPYRIAPLRQVAQVNYESE